MLAIWGFEQKIKCMQEIEPRTEQITPLAGHGREARRVPLWWQHPVDADGRPKQLMSRDQLDGFEQYMDSAEELTPEYIAENFMPDFSGVPANEMGVRVYWREGEPNSPAFPDNPEGREALLRFAAEHIPTWADRWYTDTEGWRHILFEGDCHFINLLDGTPVITPSRAARAAQWRLRFALAAGPHSPGQAAAYVEHSAHRHGLTISQAARYLADDMDFFTDPDFQQSLGQWQAGEVTQLEIDDTSDLSDGFR